MKTVVVEGKDTICVLPAEYGISLSYLHAFVPECVCVFFSKSGEEKFNSFIVVVSSLNFLIDEQISNMKVFKGTENVAIVEEFEVPPQILFHILRPFTKLINKFSATSWKKKNDSHGLEVHLAVKYCVEPFCVL